MFSNSPLIEAIIIGAAQGIAEWLPVSSEGVIVLLKVGLFQSTNSASELIREALFLHAGTFCAALIYFRKDVVEILRSLIFFRNTSQSQRSLTSFLFITTMISGLLGGALIFSIDSLPILEKLNGAYIMIAVGILLLITGALQIVGKKRGGGGRMLSETTTTDSMILGIWQGLAALPGLSRSGLTVAGLLLRNVREEDALRLSFLMSLPIVLAGNIILNAGEISLTSYTMTAFVVSFLFGLLTIHVLLKLARRINFGIFVILFGIITILSPLILHVT